MKLLCVLRVAFLVITATTSKAPGVTEDLKVSVHKGLEKTLNADDDIKFIRKVEEEALVKWDVSIHEDQTKTTQYNQKNSRYNKKQVIENDTPGDEAIITLDGNNDTPDDDGQEDLEDKKMQKAYGGARWFIKKKKHNRWFIKKKKHKQCTRWTSWRYWSVPRENYFPKYKQFTPRGWRCPVGCGPVAWAMVFGYYDRLAPWYGHSRKLFRCDRGLYGSPYCKAPPFLTYHSKSWILEIRRRLRTFCLFGGGATTPWGMRRIGGFYRFRQGGNARILSYTWWLSWTGWTRTWIRNRARNAIKHRYPAVVGVWVKSGKKKAQHYPVATKYKSRSRRCRTCWKIFGRWRCGRWKTQSQERFFLRMGWGGYKDGWYFIKTFSAFVAVK